MSHEIINPNASDQEGHHHRASEFQQAEHQKSKNQQHENESIYFRIIAFLSLTDTDVLAKSGRYDRMLAYAMVFRQLVTFVFTFLLFTYGVSLFLNDTAAVVSGFVFALTLFFLDQAIIGSDWALKNPFKGGFGIRKLLGFIPRIFYSLIIAIGLATLAEISLQANAIDEQIQKDVVENNKEYFARMNAYELELDTAVGVSEEKISALQQQITNIKSQQQAYLAAEETYDMDTIKNNIDISQVSLEELQLVQKNKINELSDLNESLAKARKDYQFWFNEAILERTGQDGRPPTEGPKYQRAVKTYEELKFLMPIIEADIEKSQQGLDAIEKDVIDATNTLNEYQKIANMLTNKEQNFLDNQQSIINAEQELEQEQVLLSALIDDKQNKLQEYRVTLQQEGLFFERKTGVLTRYIALQKIHSDAEFGHVATLFSYLLKVFFIAIELMPVIIKLFFSPFSFYSLKMYRKMHVALLQEKSLLEEAQMQYEKDKRSRELAFEQEKAADNAMKNSIMI